MLRSPGWCVLASLVGCGGPDLAGTWSGDVTCAQVDFDVQVAFEKQEKGVFVGPFTMHFEQQNTANGRVVTVDITYDAKARVADAEPQPLDFQVDYVSTACELTEGPDVIEDDCATLGFDVTVFEDGEAQLEGATWNGEDAIDIDTDGCQGAVVRL